jgi:hypothetical protein
METILEEAMRIVDGDRRAAYGHPSDNFASTASMWVAYLSMRISSLCNVSYEKAVAMIGPAMDAESVADMMVLVKMSRNANKRKRDNLVDAAGYARTGELCKK